MKWEHQNPPCRVLGKFDEMIGVCVSVPSLRCVLARPEPDPRGKNSAGWGAGLAQSMERVTPGLGVVSLVPTLGMEPA